MRKRSFMEQMGDFMSGKGFYIVLLLCVAALGVSGYYLFSGLKGPDKPVSGAVTMTVTPSARAPETSPLASATAPASTATPVPRATQAAGTVSPAVGSTGSASSSPSGSTAASAASRTPASATPSAAQTPAPATPTPATATAAVFTWPVKGEVIRGYSIETLAYDQTMGDWRIHDGIDIAAQTGADVMAPAGGTVSDIYHDDLMGTAVVILHADGILSTCSNLDATPRVEIGDTVRTGDIIGSIGGTALSESKEESHLHLSMTKDGVSVNPVTYLPEL